jgi:hypothetical protein
VESARALVETILTALERAESGGFLEEPTAVPAPHSARRITSSPSLISPV